ncbi:MAG: SurA N-terminal domain-containing protein [Anaerolineales bacterium]|nr:SurA N-terminal domain-containing protein [Anaerolineales bacterium]
MFSKRSLLMGLFLPLIFGLNACASFAPTPTSTPEPPTFTPLPPTATPPPSAAIVNGEYLTLAEFQAELTRYKNAQTALGITVTDADASKTVLEDLIAEMLLAQAARAENFNLTDADLQSRIDALGNPDTVNQWKSAHGYDDESFKAALRRSIEAAWMRDKIIADVPTTAEQIHLRQILTYNQEDANYALGQLQNGTEFDALAALYDPVTLGELGWAPRGYLLDPKADEAAFALQAGEISGVIQTDAGFHIFKALERGEHPLSPDALMLMQEQALSAWVAEKRANSAITLSP